MKKTKKLMAALVCVLLLMTLLPVTALAEDIGMAGDLQLDPANGKVYFGAWVDDWDGPADGVRTPMLWRIVAKDANAITLFCDDRAIPDGMYYSTSPDHMNWSGSASCTWLNGDFLTYCFLPKEVNAIGTYGGTETTNGVSIDISQKVILPSVEEVQNGGTWGMTAASRAFSNEWWLRSPSYYLIANAGVRQ